MRTILNSIFLLLVAIVLSSCNSENRKPIPASGDLSSSDITETRVHLSNANLYPNDNSQFFTINPKLQNSITGAMGTKISFPAECFGKINGNITIELIECYRIQDMILNHLSTCTENGSLLETEGMIYINALNEYGDTLEIINGQVKIQMPTDSIKNDIQIFEANPTGNSWAWNLTEIAVTSNSNSIKGEGYQSTEDNHSVPVLIPANSGKDTTNKTSSPFNVVIDDKIKNENIPYYIFQISQMGWINCDRFLNLESNDLIFIAPKELTTLSMYLVLDNYNSILVPENEWMVNQHIKFSNVPNGEPYTIVVLSTKAEEVLLGISSYTNHQDTITCPPLDIVTRQELTNLLYERFGSNIWNRPKV